MGTRLLTTRSAKSDYINLILPRKGLPVNTSLDQKIVRKYVL